MNICVVDNESIYLLGIKQYFKDLFSEQVNVYTFNSICELKNEILEVFDFMIINLSFYDNSNKNIFNNLKKYNNRIKVIGLLNIEDFRLLKVINISSFDSLIVRSTLIDELQMLFSFMHENRKYYSPEIIDYFNNINSNKFINYERK